MKKFSMILILLLLFLSGCGSSTNENSAPDFAGGDGGDVAPTEEQKTTEVQDTMGNQDTQITLKDRKIIYTAEVNLRVDDIEGIGEKIKNKTMELQGFLADYAVHINENTANANMSLKVPSQNYQALLDFVVQQGKPDYKREYTNDVTTQYVDLDARVTVLRAEEESLLNLLNQADKVEDILKVRAQITSTRQERESLEGQLKALKNDIEYATIQVSLYKPRNSDANINMENLNIFSRSWSGFIYGFNSLLAKTGNVVVFFFTALPTLALVALVVLGLVWIIRRRNNKGKDS
ncbi:DUF4349 domain-containing protein [Dehalobacterium formicoaceticum]|uniref:DUF4349 domain-containing protein n=1 Tax=Dehalobacterium formicoaceticum TaxID=51515 RepID=UPI0012FCA696|nr:DUF4349 domain-containing protein [Dehalobacterium formicoaceticum]